MEKWKVAAYVRLSSDDGDKAESNSITNQKSLINLFLKNNTDLKLKDFYIDDGFSGTDFNRPDFQRLLNDMKNGKINAVLVKDLSRLGRNYIEVGNYLEQIFPLYNIRFIAINDNVDSFKDPNSVNNVIVPFKNLMNDEYARDISNKVRSVLDTKKVNGEFISSIAPYGYLRDPKNKHKFIVDKVAAKVVKKIFRMILDGKSKEEVIDELNKLGVLPPRLYQMQNKSYKFEITEQMQKWDRKKLDKILKNQAYIGDLIQSKKRTISHKVHKVIENNQDDWIIVHNHHNAIIDRNDFIQVQEIIYNKDIRIKKNKEYDLFSGCLRCPDCGNTFTIIKGKRKKYYYCSSYMRNKTCTAHTIEKEKLENDVLKIINTQIALQLDIDKKLDEIIKDEEINYDIEILNNRIKEIDNNINKYEKLIESIKDDLLCKYITRKDYEEYYEEYSNMLKKYNNEKIETLEKIEHIDYNSNRNKEWLEKFISSNNIDILTKKTLNELVDEIYVYSDKNIKIKFRYQNEFIEAVDFIKQHKYDIILKEVYAY